MVKEKLIEIGEYIDDQLTDYVMIMVTNKKSEKQMADDLELFLGGKQTSGSFSAWLHSNINSMLGKSLKLTANTASRSTTSAIGGEQQQPNNEELAIQIETSKFLDLH